MDVLRYDCVDALLHQLVFRLKQEFGIVGASVSLVKLGKQPFSLSRAYGFASEEDGEPASPVSTVFDCGGLARLLAAVAAMHVLEEREITLDTDINTLLPKDAQVESTEFGSVTVLHLLTHTSGLFRGSCDIDGLRAGASRPAAAHVHAPAAAPPPLAAPPQFLSSLPAATASRGSPPSDTLGGYPGGDTNGYSPASQRRHGGPPASPSSVMEYVGLHDISGLCSPGTTYRAADVDIMLLAAIVETVSHQTYERYITSRLLAPLGMSTDVTPALVYAAHPGASAPRVRAFVHDLTPLDGLVLSGADAVKLLAALLLPLPATPAAPPPGHHGGTNVAAIAAAAAAVVAAAAADAMRVLCVNVLKRLTTQHFHDVMEELSSSCGLTSRGLGRCGKGVWMAEHRRRDMEPGGQAILLLAPEASLAILVSTNTNDMARAGTGHGFCGQVAVALLEHLRPPEQPAALLQAALPALMPSRLEAVVTLICFPHAFASATSAFEFWAVTLPDYIRVRVFQPPGRGTRQREEPLVRLVRVANAAAEAIAVSLQAGAPFALFGHGLGALVAYEAARRLQGWHQRPALHLFVSGCVAPCHYSQTGSETRPYTPWAHATSTSAEVPLGRSMTPRGGAVAAAAAAAAASATSSMRTASSAAAAEREVHTLPDDVLLFHLQQCVRTPRLLRRESGLVQEGRRALRADLECEETYRHLAASAQPMAAAVQALVLSVATPSHLEERLGCCQLLCPITACGGDSDETVSAAQLEGWKQVTHGPFTRHRMAGDHFYLEDRKGGAVLLGLIASSLARQMTTNVAWLGTGGTRPRRGPAASSGGNASGAPTGGATRQPVAGVWA